MLQTLEFQVQAIAGEGETKRVSLATVMVEIIDTNDNSPKFSEEEYKVKISESILYPEVLITVSATDEDSGKFGQILYTVSGDGADLFVIDGKQIQSVTSLDFFYFIECFLFDQILLLVSYEWHLTCRWIEKSNLDILLPSLQRINPKGVKSKSVHPHWYSRNPLCICIFNVNTYVFV